MRGWRAASAMYCVESSTGTDHIATRRPSDDASHAYKIALVMAVARIEGARKPISFHPKSRTAIAAAHQYIGGT